LICCVVTGLGLRQGRDLAGEKRCQRSEHVRRVTVPWQMALSHKGHQARIGQPCGERSPRLDRHDSVADAVHDARPGRHHLERPGQIEAVDLLQQQRRRLGIGSRSLESVERLTILDRRPRKEEIGEQPRAHPPVTAHELSDGAAQLRVSKLSSAGVRGVHG
jgi:hypothetical protein